jgi:outer membrane receptor for ferrienterochelin and colicin
MRFTSERYNLYGGISTRIGKFADWMVQVAGSGIDNLAFFVNDTSTQRNKDLNNQFEVIYDDGTLIHGKTEVAIQKTEQLRFSLAMNYYQYSLDHESEAWHKPSFDLVFYGKYNLQDKFIFNTSLIYNGKSFAKTWENNAVTAKKLDGFLDVNLGLEYRYSKNLSGFLQLNNLTNKAYYRWNNYAGHRLNALIGVTYAF